MISAVNLVLAKGNGNIVPAEAQGIAQGMLDGSFPCFARDIVEVAAFAGVLEGGRGGTIPCFRARAVRVTSMLPVARACGREPTWCWIPSLVRMLPRRLIAMSSFTSLSSVEFRGIYIINLVRRDPGVLHGHYH